MPPDWVYTQKYVDPQLEYAANAAEPVPTTNPVAMTSATPPVQPTLSNPFRGQLERRTNLPIRWDPAVLGPHGNARCGFWHGTPDHQCCQ